MGVKMSIAGSRAQSARAAASVRAAGAHHVAYDQLRDAVDNCVIPVGADEDGVFMIDWEARHVLLAGITGSGKTESVLTNAILCNALKRECAPHLLIIDAKGDCEKTFPVLVSRGYQIRMMDLRPGRGSDSFNPAHAAYVAFTEGNRALSQELAREVAEALAAQVKNNRDRFWDRTASSLIQACLLVLFEERGRGKEPTLGDVSDLIQKGADYLLNLADKHSNTKAGNMLKKAISCRDAKTTFADLIAVASEALSFYQSLAGRKVAGVSTFDVEGDLISDAPVATFLSVAGSAIEGAHSFGALLVSSVYKVHARLFGELSLDGKFIRPVRCLWDEFPQAKSAGYMPDMLATARSTNFLVLLAVQSTSQLAARHGTHESRVILSQCEIGVFMRSADEDLSREASLRSDGAIKSSHLLDLSTGEAYLTIAGLPAVKLNYAPFDTVVERASLDTIDAVSELATIRRSIAAEDVRACSDPGELLNRCQRAVERDEFAGLMSELTQHIDPGERDTVVACAKALADSIKYVKALNKPDFRVILMQCTPKQDALNPYLSEVYTLVVNLLHEIGCVDGMYEVVDDLSNAVNTMADFIEANSRVAISEEKMQICEGSLIVGGVLDVFLRSFSANSRTVVQAYDNILRDGIRMRLMHTRRILEKMIELEKQSSVSITRRIAGQGHAGDEALNRLRSFRSLGYATDCDYYEYLLAVAAQPALPDMTQIM